MQVITVYILPPSIAEWEARYRNSGRFEQARFDKDLLSLERSFRTPEITHRVTNDTVERVAKEILSYFR